MIVECYSADVYCDMENHPRGEDTPTFTGRNKRETDNKRRQAGWVKIGGKDCCPVCKRRLKQEQSQ